MTTTGDVLDLGKFTAEIKRIVPTGSRTVVTLTLADADKTLQLTTTSQGNLDLVWNGNQNVTWDIDSSENWWEAGTNTPDITFIDGDRVHFIEAVGKNQSISIIPSGVLVADMLVASDDYDYTFSDGSITAKAYVANGHTTLTDAEGKLTKAKAGTLTFNTANEFEGGIELSGGTIVLNHDKALGTWLSGDPGTQKQGMITVATGNSGTIKIVDDRTVTNRFEVGDSGTLNLDIASGKTLTISGVHYVPDATPSNDGRGGAIDLGTGSLALTAASRDIVLSNNSAQHGGALYAGASLDLSSLQSISLINYGEGANGGAVRFQNLNSQTYTFGDNVLFRENHSEGSGGALSVDGSHTVVFGSNARFIENTADSWGGAIYTNASNAAVTTSLSSNTHFQGNMVAFALYTGATLAGGGTITASQNFTLKGVISLDASRLETPDWDAVLNKFGNAKALDLTGDKKFGELELVGGVVFDGATLIVDLGESNVSDKIIVTGSVTSGAGINTVDIATFEQGVYDLVVAGDMETNFDDTFGQVLVNGNPITNPRQSATLSQNGDTLQLTTKATNLDLVWVGGDGSASDAWHIDDTTNWKQDGTNTPDTFIALDYVIFDNTGGKRDVVVGDGMKDVNAHVAGMEVSSSYEFSGGGIVGTLPVSDIQTVTGRLDVKGNGTVKKTGTANVTFAENNAAFGGSLVVDGGTFALSDGKTLGASQTAINSGATLNLGSGSTLGPTVGGLTTLNNGGTLRSGDNATIRGNADFAGNVKPDGTLNVTGDRPFDDFGFNHNTQEVVDALNDGLDDPDLRDLVNEFGNMTDDEIRDMIDQLRGTELAATAQASVLGSPWSRIHRKYDLADDERMTRALFRRQSKNKHHLRNSWGEGFYRYMDTKTDHNAVKSHEQRGGLMVGTDWNFRDHSKVGVTFGYGNPRVSGRFGNVEIDDFLIGLYSRTRVVREYYADVFVGYGLQQYDYDRRERSDRYTAGYNGRSLFATIRLSRPFRPYSFLKLTPQLELDYAQSWTDSFAEQGGPFSKTVAKAAADRISMRLGLDAKYRVHRRFDLTGRLEYSVLVSGDQYTTANSRFVMSPNSSVMELRGVDLGRSGACFQSASVANIISATT